MATSTTVPTHGKPISCKAAVLWKFNTPYTIETIEVAPPQAKEVRVRIVATGICYSDIYTWKGANAIIKLPIVPGHEGAGIVESVGPGVTSVQPGDKVFTMFLPNCQKCKFCISDRSNHCEDQWGHKSTSPFDRSIGYDGKTRISLNGKPLKHYLGSSAFSEYVVVPEASCVKVNPKTPLETACIMSCGFPTGYGASHNDVDIRKEDRVAIWGLGGVGLATVAGCKDKGANKIIGIDVNPAKEDIARKIGCTDFITKSVDETLQQLTNGEGLDYAFICIGGFPDIYNTAIRNLSVQGTLVAVGVPYKDELLTLPTTELFPHRTIRTSVCGGYKIKTDIPKLVDRYLEGELPVDQLISHKIHLDRINEGIDMLINKKSIRIVVLF